MDHQAAAALAGFADLIDVHQVPLSGDTEQLYRAFGVEEAGLFLIRPDQYIAYRGQAAQPETLGPYLKTILRSSQD